MRIRWKTRMWYTRLEVPKRDLQKRCEERFGVEINDPELLVGLLADEIIPPFWEGGVEVYEDCDDTEEEGGIILVIEIYR